ncbi:hypothetical protein CVS27_01045 [Arthrobacter glacialis]|uniref:Glycoside hydrolase 35 catalytic domain-containing protein n=2 Tax=Arthrobacter glacialis TaxID=1664 RepID=A0A2S4A133_ARTGL|nr:hypothetical protein CVS27_01045 [Arthrobacter glacialis]
MIADSLQGVSKSFPLKTVIAFPRGPLLPEGTPAMHHAVVRQPAPAVAGHLRMGNPRIRVDSQKLIRDGKAWFPVMGEFHFSRYDAKLWRLELERMREGGITVVSTYVFWQHHQERQESFVWSGNRDLRAFIGLCAELGLDAVVRIGPWVHGEARNGGFPDWLQALPLQHRSNDEAYLDHVRPFFTEIARQLDGLYFGTGGPIVAIQVENELYDQSAHILTLKELALGLGMDAPLWTATAWGGAELPENEVLPLYGGYPEAFWEDAHPGWARGSRKHYFFTDIRDDHSIGADLRTTASLGQGTDSTRYPYATCELGSGMPSAYHRRPIIPAHDVAALALAKVGSGSAWQGYYMYHGASHPVGELSSLQESIETGYPNDLPVISYDFQAPVGEHGQLRESYHRLRAQHLFLAEVGPELAGMPLTLPQLLPENLDDVETLRWSVRSDGHAGFIFVNNHQPSTDALAAKEEVQFRVTLTDGNTVTGPENPVTIPAGAYFVWPFNLDLGRGATLHSSTAQLVTSVVAGQKKVVVFSRTAGIEPVFVLDLANDDGSLRRVRLASSVEASQVELAVTENLSILLITEAAALRLWKTEVDGVPRLILAESLLVRDGQLHLDAAVQQTLGVFPAVESLLAVPGSVAPDIRRLEDHGPFREFSLHLPASAVETTVHVHTVRDAVVLAPRRSGGPQNRAAAPLTEDYEQSARFDITFAAEQLPVGTKNVLHIDWVGDCARALVGGRLVSDNYWNGLPWEMDLSEHRDELLLHGLSIRAFAYDPGAAIYVEESIRPQRPTLEISSVGIRHSALVPVTIS